MRVPTCVALLLAVVASPARPQSPPSLSASLMVGSSDYDLSGTGNSFVAAAHLSWQWQRIVILEPGVTYFQYRAPYHPVLFPEVSMQFVLPSGAIRPYLGVGLGLSIVPGEQLVGDRSSVHQWQHAVAGLRLDSAQWGIRGELRIRAPHEFGATTADVMFGVTRRLR